MPYPQTVYVFEGSTPYNVQTSSFRVDGATFMSGATATVSGGPYTFTATPTGNTVNDPLGVPRPELSLVCTGFSGSNTGDAFLVHYGETPYTQKVFYYEVPSPN